MAQIKRIRSKTWGRKDNNKMFDYQTYEPDLQCDTRQTPLRWFSLWFLTFNFSISGTQYVALNYSVLRLIWLSFYKIASMCKTLDEEPDRLTRFYFKVQDRFITKCTDHWIDATRVYKHFSWFQHHPPCEHVITVKALQWMGFCYSSVNCSWMSFALQHYCSTVAWCIFDD